MTWSYTPKPFPTRFLSFLLLILLEELVARRMGKQVNRGMDVISSLSSGMTNTLKNLMGYPIVWSLWLMVDR
ncbi:hypothetical protein [Nitritalea halalkaliphila]|uniref:hypothetical protein n=1 Tax=Nitritalea halalkaliphila TaxID=590849 RepID=UPI001EE645AF|nr:hypothetical protein [Nitritalea halalkaliphila]